MLARQPPEEADHGWITTARRPPGPLTVHHDRASRRQVGGRDDPGMAFARPELDIDPAHDIARIQHRDPVAPGEVVFDHRRVGHRQSANGSAGGDRRRAEAGHRRVRWRRRGTQPYQRGLIAGRGGRKGPDLGSMRRPVAVRNRACMPGRTESVRRAGRAPRTPAHRRRRSRPARFPRSGGNRPRPAAAHVPEVGAAIARGSPTRALPPEPRRIAMAGRVGGLPQHQARPRAARHPTRACGTRPRSPRARRGRRAAPSAIR